MIRKIIIILAILTIVFSVPFSGPAFSQGGYMIKEMTSEVKTALDGRRSRYDEVKALKQEGKAGENNRGYLKAFTEGENILKVIENENADRKIIYETIAKQNNIENEIGTIEKIFAETRRNNAGDGEKIQLEDGKWVEK